MIRAVLIDDEPKNNRILKLMLEEFCPQLTIEGQADNAEEGVTLIQETEPDLVFLDIEMPFGSGFDLLDRLKPVNFEIIFITAFNNYSLKAIKYSALDYLLKPVSIDELIAAVNKAAEKIKARQVNTRIENLLYNLKKPAAAVQKLALPSKEGYVFVSLSDIIRCESKNGYAVFHIKGMEKITSSKNIKEYESLLQDDMFLRIHNSHIININYVAKYHRGRGGLIEMEDGTTLEVATRRKEELMARFGLTKPQ
ncbi:LytTR family DNA-binding domain-containing protein [Paraflavitalea sp. CAU 1676]|uniref:LytR/AlgR family response regulator transcription factor n=1 Tax=Paraflavitalea sp. CAU 1676 TaxID=3032598 RepID=UPI0023D9BE38|nr:LytTR family DNA-binding domain-containing protein [Paraflavitalea sp. CAU 1676]MDF2188760.1 LytTR family DNA-binding domain-containing protein [Paraflavitalea sp. CAU 1676]